MNELLLANMFFVAAAFICGIFWGDHLREKPAAKEPNQTNIYDSVKTATASIPIGQRVWVIMNRNRKPLSVYDDYKKATEVLNASTISGPRLIKFKEDFDQETTTPVSTTLTPDQFDAFLKRTARANKTDASD